MEMDLEAMNDNDRSGIGGGTTQSFPSPEWIAQRVQAHVMELSNETCDETTI
jgi:hypothetical protein